MDNLNLEDLEIKYPGISEKEGWLDLHLRRGMKEINDDDFKIEIIKFGMDENDAKNYIQFLVNINDSFEDLSEDSKFFEMLEIRMKYENFSDKESELKELVILGKIEETKIILKEDFQMDSQEVETVITALKFEIKMD